MDSLGHNGGCKGRSEVDGNGNGDGKKPRKGCSGWLKGEGGEGIREGKGVGCVVGREGSKLLLIHVFLMIAKSYCTYTFVSRVAKTCVQCVKLLHVSINISTCKNNNIRES